MSTRIYDAYKLPADTDPVLACLHLADALEPVWRRFVLQGVGAAGLVLHELIVEKGKPWSEAVTKACDLFGFGHVSEKHLMMVNRAVRRRPFTQAVDVIEAAAKVSDEFHVHPAADFNFLARWMVDPAPNLSGGHDLYAKLATSQQDYRDVFTHTTEATDFHYQNQSDPPEDVTDTDWEARKQVWERILPKSGGYPHLGPLWRFTEGRSLTFESIRGTFSDDAWLTAQNVLTEAGQSHWFTFRDEAHREAFTDWFTAAAVPAPSETGADEGTAGTES